MSLTHRLVACLDVHATQVVKGVGFRHLCALGDPVALARQYETDGADEIVFLDVSASVEQRELVHDVVRATASALFIPLTVGGGIRSVDDVDRALRSGADKVAVNSAAVERPALLTEAAYHFGAQCVVASIDAARSNERWVVHVRGGRDRTELDAVSWARECVERGAGEILLTSIDRDGARSGYDLELTSAVVAAVGVPVVASGGAGEAQHLIDAIDHAGADAVLVAGVLHDGTTTIRDLKRLMTAHGLPMRTAA